MMGLGGQASTDACQFRGGFGSLFFQSLENKITCNLEIKYLNKNSYHHLRVSKTESNQKIELNHSGLVKTVRFDQKFKTVRFG